MKEILKEWWRQHRGHGPIVRYASKRRHSLCRKLVDRMVREGYLETAFGEVMVYFIARIVGRIVWRDHA